MRKILVNYSLRRLMQCIALFAIILGAIVAWHRWYNHEIARLELGNGYEVRLRSAYEGWRGPRKTLRVGLYRKGQMFDSVVCSVKSYSRMKSRPGVYYPLDQRYVYVSIPSNSPRFIIGDLREGEFTNRLSILTDDRLSAARGNRSNCRLKWRSVYEKIKLHNPRMPIFLN